WEKAEIFRNFLRIEYTGDPASRISVPFYPGNFEYFPVFLNSSSFRQIRSFWSGNVGVLVL
ncbi:MAG: hypothetical protein ACLVJ4_13655, partial [Mediterraneibacter sp.]